MPPTDRAVDHGEDAQKLAIVREALIEGENSGPPQPFDMAEFLAKQRAVADERSKTAPLPKQATTARLVIGFVHAPR